MTEILNYLVLGMVAAAAATVLVGCWVLWQGRSGKAAAPAPAPAPSGPVGSVLPQHQGPSPTCECTMCLAARSPVRMPNALLGQFNVLFVAVRLGQARAGVVECESLTPEGMSGTVCIVVTDGIWRRMKPTLESVVKEAG